MTEKNISQQGPVLHVDEEMTVAVPAPTVQQETNIETHQVSCTVMNISKCQLNIKTYNALPLYISHLIAEIIVFSCFLFHLFKI